MTKTCRKIKKLFDATDTLRACLNVTGTVLQNMRLNEARAGTPHQRLPERD